MLIRVQLSSELDHLPSFLPPLLNLNARNLVPRYQDHPNLSPTPSLTFPIRPLTLRPIHIPIPQHFVLFLIRWRWSKLFSVTQDDIASSVDTDERSDEGASVDNGYSEGLVEEGC